MTSFPEVPYSLSAPAVPTIVADFPRQVGVAAVPAGATRRPPAVAATTPRSSFNGTPFIRASMTPRAIPVNRPNGLFSAAQLLLAEDADEEEDRSAADRGEDEGCRLGDADREQPEPDEEAESEPPQEGGDAMVDARW